MRELYRRSHPCIILFVITSLAIVFVSLITNYGSNTFSLLSLPSSPWTWTSTVISSSSSSPTHSSKTALYPTFSVNLPIPFPNHFFPSFKILFLIFILIFAESKDAEGSREPYKGIEC